MSIPMEQLTGGDCNFGKEKKQFVSLWELLLRLLRKENKLSVRKISLDGSPVQSFAFKDKTGYSGKHHKTGIKILTIADENGIPLALISAKGNIVDITLLKKQFMASTFLITHSKEVKYLQIKVMTRLHSENFSQSKN